MVLNTVSSTPIPGSRVIRAEFQHESSATPNFLMYGVTTPDGFEFDEIEMDFYNHTLYWDEEYMDVYFSIPNSMETALNMGGYQDVHISLYHDPTLLNETDTSMVANLT